MKMKGEEEIKRSQKVRGGGKELNLWKSREGEKEEKDEGEVKIYVE